MKPPAKISSSGTVPTPPELQGGKGGAITGAIDFDGSLVDLMVKLCVDCKVDTGLDPVAMRTLNLTAARHLPSPPTPPPGAEPEPDICLTGAIRPYAGIYAKVTAAAKANYK